MTDMTGSRGPVLVYTIHRVEPWFAEVGRHMGYERSVTVSDLKGEADRNLSSTFYSAYRRHKRANTRESDLFDRSEIEDVIARCRLLRWLDDRQATSMVLAMGEACEEVLDEVRPEIIAAFPIDRYVSDVLARLGARRGIPFHELTASALPNMAMVLHRSKLLTRPMPAPPKHVEQMVSEIANPQFTPTYVQNQKPFNWMRWQRVFWYFRLRGWFFWLLKTLKRDPLSLHYMDAQSFLGHKPRLADVKVIGMVDRDWDLRLDAFAEDKRLFVGLQLFPEASIDYWVEERSLIDYEEVLMEVAHAFAEAGYAIVVKDHPLQFGFRQRELIERLKRIPSAIFVPYEVSGNAILDRCAVNFTLTGTLGMQAALLGKKSIAAACYYSNEEDFVLLRNREDIGSLPARVASFTCDDLATRQKRIVGHLLQGSFDGDFFSFARDRTGESPAAANLGRAFGRFVRECIGKC